VTNTGSPQDLIAAGKFNRNATVLMGSCLDEFSLMINLLNLTTFVPTMTERQFDKILGYLGQDRLDAVKRLYDPSVYEYPSSLGLFSQWWWTAMRVATDNGIPFHGFPKGVALGHCSTRRVAENLVEHGTSKLYMYNFARSLLGGQVGHGMDVPFIFKMNPELGVDPGNKDLADAMIAYWVNFAATGTPSPADGHVVPLNWPAYSLQEKANLRFQATTFAKNLTVEREYRKPVCDFWDELAGRVDIVQV